MELGQKLWSLSPRLEVHLTSFNRTHNVFCLFITLILLAGCTGTDLQVSMLTQIPQTFKATFDGIECTHSGPTEVSVGEYSFLLENLSDENLGLWTGQILDGHVYQDMLDLQSEPGKYFRKPDWFVDTVSQGYRIEPNGDKVYAYKLLEAGEYVIDIGWSLPETLWFCGSFQVVDE